VWCTLRNLLAATVAIVTVPPPFALGQTVPIRSQTAQVDSPLVTTDRTLLDSLNRISRGSPLWREAIAAVRKTGRRVFVVTPADGIIRSRHPQLNAEVFEPSALAEAIPVLDEDAAIPAVVIVVNLRLVRQTHDARMSVPREFEADLDRILVHEVYGHAVPYLLAGNLSGRCADPAPQESAGDACSIRRENAVRSELGLGRRDDHGVFSLRLAMRSQ
jgi:hypothetical protein